jgi:hemolysin D
MDLAVNQTLLSRLSGKQVDQDAAADISLQFTAGNDAGGDLLYKRLLNEKWDQYRARLSSLQSAVREAKAEYAATEASVSKLQQILPIIRQRAAKVKQLHERRYASEEEYLQFEQESIERSHDLEMEQQRLEQLRAARDEAVQQVTALQTETRVAALESITESKRQLAVLREELKKASDLNARQTLYAPVAGRVHELTVTTQGGIVTEAQPLMNIVPDKATLEVEAYLENKDIGFVDRDMLAEIKIHAFPFTKYGIVNAAINTISDDATIDEERGLLYRLLLTMEQDTILVQGREVKLIPGMEVTAEIKTGKRRLIEFFMAPLLQHGQESLRER